MNKEKFIELVNKLNEENVRALIRGINQITFEYGWDNNLDDSELIKTLWKLPNNF